MPNKNSQTGKRRKTVDQHLKRSAALKEQGLFQEAISELERALRTAADKMPAYKELADLYRSQWEMDKAIAAIKAAVELKPTDVQARETLLEMLIDLARFDDAIRESKELLRLSPRSLSARDTLGIAYLQKGMLDEALEVTNELISMDPSSPINHFKKACLYQQKGDIGNAIHEYGRVIEMRPDGEIAQEAQQAMDVLDSDQLRHIVMLAIEDYIFRAKLIRDPEAAATERGYHLSHSGINALKQIQFDDLPEVYSEWKQRYYH